jgi:predicted lipoprotein with Yx(FWY)xxD motif
MFGSPPLDAAAVVAVAASSASPKRAIFLTCSSLSRVTAMATRRSWVRIGAVAALAAIVAAVAAGWIGSASSSAAARHAAAGATVQTKKVKKYGVVLVNSKGRTLYMFVPDHQKKVTCTSKACVALWPPLKVKKGQKPTAGGAAKKALLGVDKSPDGYRVVTYKGWPLYSYVTDTKPGQTTGQGLNSAGGKWYVLSPSGKVIK